MTENMMGRGQRASLDLPCKVRQEPRPSRQSRFESLAARRPHLDRARPLENAAFTRRTGMSGRKVASRNDREHDGPRPAIGTGEVFSKGRDFAAWLGLVPRQISTGDRTILGRISKRGNRYLRVLFVQAAWVILIKLQSWERHGLKSWIETRKKRLHHNMLAIALANKLARVAWAVLATGRGFEMTRIGDVGIRPA
jgi:hypothetical protein